MVAAVAVGYSFDLFGRKLLIALSYALMTGLIWALPYVPSMALLTVCRAGIQVAFQYLHSHPLIIDYIKSESRGKATSLQALGNGIGELIAMTIFISIQLATPVETGEWIVGSLVCLMAIVVVLMFREPSLKKAEKPELLVTADTPDTEVPLLP